MADAHRPPLAVINDDPSNPRKKRRKGRTGKDGVVRDTTRNVRKTLECLFTGTVGEAEAAKAGMTEKIKTVKELMGGVEDTTTTEMIMALLDNYLSAHGYSTSSPSPSAILAQYQPCPDDKMEQRLMVLAEESLRHLAGTIFQHGERCKKELTLRSLVFRGHTGIAKFACANGCNYLWTTSPHVGQPFLVNLRYAHLFIV
ncbi:hypothetical protein Bbelb_272000 [Branchiostoma belcheri]|nr:hypothetical protein Bbelb_272000 [Branchiostoma belcheri]